MTQPRDYSLELTPVQAAFLMRHLSPEDRTNLIANAGDIVIDLCDPDTQARLVRTLRKA